jgi:hypothetical protein
MEVIILSKTHFGKMVCVGGMVLNTNQYVRLLNPGGWYQYADTEFDIGDIWDIKFIPSKDLKAPHVEDVIIQSKSYVKSIDNITDFVLKSGAPIWKGSINNIFDGKIIWAKTGSGFLSIDVPNYPSHSVGFWLSDKPLHFEDNHYIYPVGNKKLIYKGLPDAVDPIPANTLIRVSLPKWWKPKDSDVEERCYLQLSGWYDYDESD